MKHQEVADGGRVASAGRVVVQHAAELAGFDVLRVRQARGVADFMGQGDSLPPIVEDDRVPFGTPMQ